MITLIWAQANNQVIGTEGKMPWHLPAEMAHFVASTLHKPVLMGRKTWQSLTLKPLPERENLVLTHQPVNNFPKEVKVVQDLDKLINQYKDEPTELMIIGGREVFDQTIKKADQLIVSFLDQAYEGDCFAPLIDSTDWSLVKTVQHEGFQVKTYLRSTTQREIGS